MSVANFLSIIIVVKRNTVFSFSHTRQGIHQVLYTKQDDSLPLNVQTAVDKGSHLIAEFEVTNHNTDQLLNEIAQSAKENLEVETIEVVADKDMSRKIF